MFTLEAMQKAGIKHLIFTINPKKTDLLTFLGNGKQFGMEFSYCIHPEPRSLPESINEAYHLIKNKTVIFAMPDTCVLPPDFLNTLLREHEANYGGVATFGCFQTDNPTKFGMVKYEGDIVLEIIDKPQFTDLQWMWGAIVWSPDVTEKIKDFVKVKKGTDAGLKEMILTDAFSPLIKEEKVFCYRFAQGSYQDLGTYDEIRKWIKGG